MLVAITNPTKFPPPAGKKGKSAKLAATKPRIVKGASAMAKKHRSAAQKAATRKMLAANRAKHRNPSNPRKATRRRTYRAAAPHRRKTHRNPSYFSGSGVLGELMSKEGLLMVGGAFVAPMAVDFVQEKIWPTASGWTKILFKLGLVAAGAWAIDKFGKQRKAAIAFGVTGAAVVASDAVRLYRGTMNGLSEGEADFVSTRPELMAAFLQGNAGGMADPYQIGMADPYQIGMAGAFEDTF